MSGTLAPEVRCVRYFGFFYLLDCFIQFQVTGIVPIWAKAPPPDEPLVHRRALCEQLWGWYLAQVYLASALKLFWHLDNTTEHLSETSASQPSLQQAELPPPRGFKKYFFKDPDWMDLDKCDIWRLSVCPTEK